MSSAIDDTMLAMHSPPGTARPLEGDQRRLRRLARRAMPRSRVSRLNDALPRLYRWCSIAVRGGASRTRRRWSSVGGGQCGYIACSSIGDGVGAPALFNSCGGHAAAPSSAQEFAMFGSETFIVRIADDAMAPSGRATMSGLTPTSPRPTAAWSRCATPTAAGRPSCGSSSSATGAAPCARSMPAVPSAPSTPATRPTSAASWCSLATRFDRHRWPRVLRPDEGACLASTPSPPPCGQLGPTDGRAIKWRGSPTRLHQRAPPLEQIAARVSGLGLVLDHVRERCFHDRVRRADPLCGVAADARTEPVSDRRESK